MIKQKFDRMARDVKPTGNPKCPSPVRRAKQIAHSIMSRANAMTIGRHFSDEDESDTESTIDLTNSNSEVQSAANTLNTNPGSPAINSTSRTPTLGQRSNKQKSRCGRC